MKKLACLLLTFIFLHCVQAQTNKWSVSISLGPAFPLGKFASKNINDSTASFAKTGISLSALAEYKLSKHFGLVLLINGEENKVENKAIVSQFEAASPNVLYNVDMGTWKIGKIMAGGSYSTVLDKKEKWHFTGRVLAGALKTDVPSIVLSGAYTNQQGFPVVFQSSQSKTSLSWAFTYLAGVGIKYDLNKRFFVRSDLDYSSSSPKVPYYTSLTNGSFIFGNSGPILIANPNPNLKPNYYKQPITSLALGFGAGINL